MKLKFLKYGKGLELNLRFAFISIGRYWQGIYLHFPKHTVRVFLFGIDCRRRYNESSRI